MVKVLYNGIDVFARNGAPTPFVSVSDRMINYGDRWGTAKTISLRGMVTGSACYSRDTSAYIDLLNKQNGIISGFSQDFKSLVIYDTISNKNNFSGNYVRIEDINFESSPYFNQVPFKVDLTYYPPELFTGFYGVTAPVSSIKYSEQPDRSVNITRTFSAKGFNTSSISNNALQNAINYVSSLTGNSNIIAPIFGGNNLVNLISTIQPRKKSETINRSESTYSLTFDYSVREGSQTSSLLTYTTDIQYDEKRGFYNVSLKGNLSAGTDKTMVQLREEFKLLDTYSLANYIFNITINPNNSIDTYGQEDAYVYISNVITPLGANGGYVGKVSYVVDEGNGTTYQQFQGTNSNGYIFSLTEDYGNGGSGGDIYARIFSQNNEYLMGGLINGVLPFSFTFPTLLAFSSGITLNPNPESININEIEESNSIDFSYTYTTDPTSVKLDYNIAVNEEYVTDKISVSFDATLTAKGPQNIRLPQLEQSLSGLNIYNYCNSGYNSSVANPSAVLNRIPQKYEIKRNLTNNNNSYNISAVYDNSPTVPVDSSVNFKAFSWSINVTPSLNAYFPIQLLNGNNAAFDMNYYKRGKITINGAATVSGNSDYSSSVRAQALNIFDQYKSNLACSGSTRVEDAVERNKFADENGYTYTFNISDTCETPIFKL
jgi:hypothetical protein